MEPAHRRGDVMPDHRPLSPIEPEAEGGPRQDAPAGDQVRGDLVIAARYVQERLAREGWVRPGLPAEVSTSLIERILLLESEYLASRA